MGKKRPRVFRVQRASVAELFDRGASVEEAAALLGQPLAAVRSMFRMVATLRGVTMSEDEGESEVAVYLLRLPKELHEWFKAESRSSGRSLRWLMCNALEQYVQRIEAGRRRGKD